MTKMMNAETQETKVMNDMAKFCIVSLHSTLLCFCEVLLQGEAITVQYHA